MTQMTKEDWSCLRHFKQYEFNCSHTNKNLMTKEFMEKLDELRHICEFPFAITSGYRDVTHPEEAKKPIKGGTHTMGLAADIAVSSGTQRRTIVEQAIQLGFSGIGVAKGFVHVDIRNGTPVLWTY